MITGFNTDVDFQGTTYHVQTEDKGLATPLILSLVYNRGTVLASKRSPYEDLVEKGFDEKVLAERLQKQHKTICAAIRAGRIEQLKEMMAKDSAAKRKKIAPDKSINIQTIAAVPVQTQNQEKTEQKSNGNSAPKVESSISPILETKQIQAEKPSVVQAVSNGTNGTNKVSVYKGNESPIPKPKYDFTIKSATATVETFTQTRISEIEDFAPENNGEQLIIEAVEVIELDDEMILPAEAVEVVTKTAPQKSSGNKLKLEIFGDDVFKSGEKKTMSILVYRGDRKSGLDGAQVMIKVLGAAFRPLIFHGKTDAQGVAKIHLQMALFKQGRAAILIKAMSEGEETELRRTIKHK